MSEPGDPGIPTLAGDLDIRTDVPRYRVWRHGELVEEPTDIKAHLARRPGGFAIGCSFSFEEALIEDGIAVRHIELRLQRADVPHHHRVRAGRAVFTGRWWCRCGQCKPGGRDPRRADHLALSVGARCPGASRHAADDRHCRHRASRTMATPVPIVRMSCRSSGRAA